MESIAQCGDHLRLSADGTHLCTDCPDGEPQPLCCVPFVVPPTAQTNDCGQRANTNPLIFHRYCLMESRGSHVQNQSDDLGTLSSRYEEEVELVRPVSSTGASCGVAFFAPFRTRVTRDVLFANPDDQDIHENQEGERCGQVVLGCPPIGQWVSNNPAPYGSWPASMSSFSVRLNRSIPGPFGGFASEMPATLGIGTFVTGTQTITRSANWTSDGTEFVFTYTETGEDRVAFGNQVTTWTTTYIGRFRVANETNCDGTPSPHAGACEGAIDTPCNPAPTDYLIGSPCNPNAGGPLVLFPRYNVTACAVVPTQNGCVQISPQANFTTRPDLINAVVDFRVVDAQAGYPTTCCECEPSCPSDPIVPSPCWAGGVRNGITGVWVPNEPFVASGACCCNPDDLITITELESVWITPGTTETRKILAPVVIRRGDPWILETLNRITNTATGELVQDVTQVFGNEFDPIAPFDCSGGPWSGSVNAQGFGPGQLQIPQGFVGLHTAADGGVRDMPCPIGPDGTGNSVTVLSKNVSVTCTTFAYDGLWEWEGGSRVTHRLRLSITPAPNSQRPECSGGCGQPGNGGPVAGPDGGAVPFPGPGGSGIGGLMGGCGGCGRAGEL